MPFSVSSKAMNKRQLKLFSSLLFLKKIFSVQVINLGTKFVLFTLSQPQRVKVCRELFTAIFSEGYATESYNIFTAYLAYFDLGLDINAEKFSYSNETYNLTELSKATLDLD